jgi:hypothetical protein
MGNRDHDLGGSIAGGMLSGWGPVLGPLVAIFAGIFLGELAAAEFDLQARSIVTVAFVVLPYLTLASVYAFLINLAIVGALLRYLLYEEYRVEILLAVIWLTGLQVFLLALRISESPLGLWDGLRAASVFAAIPSNYVPLRIRARRRYVALQKLLDEERLHRLRGGVPPAQASQGNKPQ